MANHGTKSRPGKTIMPTQNKYDRIICAVMAIKRAARKLYVPSCAMRNHTTQTAVMFLNESSRQRIQVRKQVIKQNNLSLSKQDIDKIMTGVNRIVAHGNILLQTGRVVTETDLERQKKEIMDY